MKVSKNLANIITILRILIVPVFIVLLIKNMMLYALILFAIAGISDGLDGIIARCFDQKTKLGSYLDPLADKVLIISGFICLFLLKIVPGWFLFIVISRDLFIYSGVAVFSICGIPVEIDPTFTSKCTTTAQLIIIFLLLVSKTFPCIILNGYLDLLYVFTAMLTIASGMHYTYKGLETIENTTENALDINNN